ncbi:MAG: hypothetical protein ABI707_05330 [Ferruginibacter sp.]
MQEAQNFGSGEQRFNAGIYKSSHNSYDRKESLAQQIDDYNVWQIELDIYDYEGELKVNHNCDPLLVHEADSLFFLLSKMVTESKTFTNKFTIVYLDLKGNGLDGCIIGNWGDDLNDRIKSTFLDALGKEHIYPSTQFINQDKKKWPSFQELVRRGFFWCVIIDWHGETPVNAVNDPVFFTAVPEIPADINALTENTVLVCMDGGCNANPIDKAPGPKGDRWIYRVYPDGACASDCGLQNGDYWRNAVDKKFTLVASNCVNRSHTFDTNTHSPCPLFVNNNAFNNCPVEGEGCEWGTHGFPFHSLADAISRASPMVTVLIKSGEYLLRTNGAGFIIDKPMVLKAVDGLVRIK